MDSGYCGYSGYCYILREKQWYIQKISFPFPHFPNSVIICSAATCEELKVNTFVDTTTINATIKESNQSRLFFKNHLVEGPSLFCCGYDLLGGKDEPVEAGVSQLNAANTNHQLFVGGWRSSVLSIV